MNLSPDHSEHSERVFEVSVGWAQSAEAQRSQCERCYTETNERGTVSWIFNGDHYTEEGPRTAERYYQIVQANNIHSINDLLTHQLPESTESISPCSCTYIHIRDGILTVEIFGDSMTYLCGATKRQVEALIYQEYQQIENCDFTFINDTAVATYLQWKYNLYLSTGMFQIGFVHTPAIELLFSKQISLAEYLLRAKHEPSLHPEVQHASPILQKYQAELTEGNTLVAGTNGLKVESFGPGGIIPFLDLKKVLNDASLASYVKAESIVQLYRPLPGVLQSGNRPVDNNITITVIEIKKAQVNLARPTNVLLRVFNALLRAAANSANHN